MEYFEKIFADYGESVYAEGAAKMLDISVPKLRRLARENKIPSIKLGKRLVFFKNSIIDFKLAIANSKIKEINKNERY